MHIAAIVDYFKFKIVGSIFVLACWKDVDRVKLARELFAYGLSTTFTCDPDAMENIGHLRFPGILYIHQQNDSLLEKVNRKYFALVYKWLVIGDTIPEALHNIRYDADVVLMTLQTSLNFTNNGTSNLQKQQKMVYLNDVYVHPRDGASVHPWAYWTKTKGIQLSHDRQRIERRSNLRQYPLKIATPLGHYSDKWYDGSFREYLLDNTMPEKDSGVRCGYKASMLYIDALNASEVLMGVELWSSEINNNSMLLILESGLADLSGGILRLLSERRGRLDFILSIWPFRVGFAYISERESSSNMYLEPFTAMVWWACLVLAFILALAQRITAKHPVEKDGACMGTLATWLQQDASAVPEGMSGRLTFIVLSISAMLVHAYYTSAIVSALMSSGTGGPDSLRALADSRYSIASEDYDYIRYLYFDVKTNWDDLEYLKKKKMTSQFYQDIETGVELIREGNTAYHSEFNQIYPYFKTFTDDQLCKLKHVDTIPETMTFVTTSPQGQWTELFRSTGYRLHEVGLTKRLVTELRILPPPCRAALLAERVKFGDVAPLLGLSVLGAVTSFMMLGLEILHAKWGNIKRKRGSVADSETGFVRRDEEDIDE